MIRGVILRRHLQKQLDSGLLSADQTKAVKKALADKHIFHALRARISKSMGDKRMALGDGKILQWLWDNREQIIAFVLEIIKLFGG